jgi:hypothetical protein
MIIYHVPWTFEWQITIYNDIGEFIIAHIYYNTYYILIIIQTYNKIMNTKIQNEMVANLFTQKHTTYTRYV